MNVSGDVDSRLRAVSELRRLCLGLPHLETPAERRLLARFAELVASPRLATRSDVDALAIGWRAWWRAGRVADLAAMADRVDRGLVEHDRRLATLATAARAVHEGQPGVVGPGMAG